MKKSMLILGFGLIASLCNAQLSGFTAKDENAVTATDSTLTHRVEMGETVMLIAKKYHITPKDIYNLNPDAVNGISYNTVLSLPADKIVKKTRKPMPATAQAYTSDKD